MYFAYPIAAFFATLSTVTASPFNAVYPWGPPGPESSQCYTLVAATRAHHQIATNWHTSFTPCTVTSTKIVETTITPKSTITSTVTTTSTVSTVDVVPAPATFTPIQTSLPGSTYGGSGGADPVEKREAFDRFPVKRASSNGPGLAGNAGHPKYPQGVVCNIWTHHGCSTTVVTSTKTVIETKSTSYTTVTTTTGVTSTSTTATVYAACATNNFADAYLGTPFVEVVGGFSGVSDATVDTAYDCCVAAITFLGPGVSPDTSVWAFVTSGTSGANCFIGTTSDTCPNPATNPSTAITSSTGNLVVGNSFCGEIDAATPEILPSSIAARVRRAAPTAH